MSRQVGLISDPHASPEPLFDALSIFRRREIDIILCAGDIAGYGSDLERSVEALSTNDCHAVLGNHDLWWLADEDGEGGTATSYLRGLSATFVTEVEGKVISMVHGAPPDLVMDGIRLLDEDGRVIPEQREFWSERLESLPCDVLVVGHTHQVFAERFGDLLLVNPGSTCFNHTCAILTLPELEVEFIPLCGREPLLSWSWGMIGRRGGA
ncbi:MAG: hypothetical protein C0616_11285 [Desulfuromonas sp.]|nr:MAG: hypothetical protein C0616_11285 [Desulfuromonas sp.]